MEFDGIQMTLIAIFLASAVAVLVVCDFLRKTFFRPATEHHGRGHRRRRHPERVQGSRHDFHGLTEFAKRSALPVDAEVIAPDPEPQALQPLPTPVVLQPQVAASTPSPLPERFVDAHLWNVIEGGAAAPRGLLDQEAWQQAIASDASFNGVAFSIGINDADGSMWHSPGLMRSVSQDISRLLGERDFGCRTAYDEFVVVFPQEANRQRRWKQITTQLWDCQLRGQRARSVRFSWGGVDVRNRPLSDAIAAAGHRMRETKRLGDSIANGCGSAPRVAVSGAASHRLHRRAV